MLCGSGGRHGSVLDRHDLSDEEWARLEPLLPGGQPRRGGQWFDHRRVVNGVLWRTRAGAPWRDLPPGYGHWKTVYNLHRHWSADGTWERILAELQTGSDLAFEGEWAVGVDATVIRAHQHAAGAPIAPPKDVPAHRLAPAVVQDAAKTPATPGGDIELHETGRRRGGAEPVPLGG